MVPSPTGDSMNEPAELAEEPESAQRDIDLQMLAERIFQLLKEDARLERERSGGRQPW